MVFSLKYGILMVVKYAILGGVGKVFLLKIYLVIIPKFCPPPPVQAQHTLLFYLVSLNVVITFAFLFLSTTINSTPSK